MLDVAFDDAPGVAFEPSLAAPGNRRRHWSDFMEPLIRQTSASARPTAASRGDAADTVVPFCGTPTLVSPDAELRPSALDAVVDTRLLLLRRFAGRRIPWKARFGARLSAFRYNLSALLRSVADAGLATEMVRTVTIFSKCIKSPCKARIDYTDR